MGGTEKEKKISDFKNLSKGSNIKNRMNKKAKLTSSKRISEVNLSSSDSNVCNTKNEKWGITIELYKKVKTTGAERIKKTKGEKKKI